MKLTRSYGECQVDINEYPPVPKETVEKFVEWAKYVADIERLETENAELTTHINELEKERVQLDDTIKELSSKCGQLEYDRDALAVMKDELSSKTEQLEKKLDIAVKAFEELQKILFKDSPVGRIVNKTLRKLRR